jgi:hypothetical protein
MTPLTLWVPSELLSALFTAVFVHVRCVAAGASAPSHVQSVHLPGLGFRGKGLGFTVEGLVFRIQGQGLGFRV